MTKKQYAFIIKAKESIKEIRSLSIRGQGACGNYDGVYHRLADIEDICDEFLKDFEDTEPNCQSK